MTYGQPSGTTNFNPAASSLLVDAFDRIGIYDLENKHVISGQRSMNLLATSDWSNRGANLFRMVEVVFPLTEGVAQYNLTADVATVYDVFRRQYSMNGPENYTPQFSTVINTPDVTIQLPGQSSPVGSYISILIPVAVGGLVLYGFYKVTSTPTANSVVVTAANNATSTVTDGGVVPEFATTMGSQNVTVTLPEHGLSAGDPFNVPVSTPVGGITIYGNYTIQSITDGDNFIIQASSNALSAASAFENSGQAYISTQNQVAPYTDILVAPLSRYDYAAQANKTAPGPPTSVWVNKQIIPQMNFWPVTDATGPYEAHVWVMKQIQDVSVTGGQTMDLPSRFYYAFVIDLARDLAMKFAPSLYATLKAEANDAWDRAEGTDVENTSSFILPLLPSGLT